MKNINFIFQKQRKKEIVYEYLYANRGASKICIKIRKGNDFI